MLVLILNDERGYIIYINGNHYPDILIKVSQREYLEDIKNDSPKKYMDKHFHHIFEN